LENIINGKLLERFIKLAGDRMDGDWIIIGGTVLPLLGLNFRVTVDIDFVPVKDSDHAQTIKIMEIADELGLPVETINQAGAFFLTKISEFQKHLILIKKGKTAKIFRPDVTLFLLLKMKRLTESDLSDCLAYLKYCKNHNEKLEQTLVQESIKEIEKQQHDKEYHERMNKLKEAVDKY